MLFERLPDSGNGGSLLADGHVDATHLLRDIPGSPVVLLVNDRVDGQGGLARLAVTDDQLTLATADGNHGVDGLHARLHRLANRLALRHAGSLKLQRAAALGDNVTHVVDGLAQRVDHATQEVIAHGHRENLTGAVDFLAFFNACEVTQDDDADITGVEVLCQAQRAVFETKQLVGHYGGKTLHLCDAVTSRGHATDLDALRAARVIGRGEVCQGVADVIGVDGQFGHLQSLLS